MNALADLVVLLGLAWFGFAAALLAALALGGCVVWAQARWGHWRGRRDA